MADLFDLPFEEPAAADALEGKPELDPEPALTPTSPEPVPLPTRRILTVSELTGEIVTIHHESGQPVQFGDPLFSVRPA